MSSVASNLIRKHRLTVNDYYRMAEAGILRAESRVELIDGEILDMSPIGSLHAGTVSYLLTLLNRAVGDQAIVNAQNPLRLNEYSEPQPDITLLRPRGDFYRSGHPKPEDVLLLVEIADSSFRYDREVKIPLYAQHGIPEAWMVDLERKQLTIFHTPTAQSYQSIVQPDDLRGVSLTQLAGVELNLTGLF